MSATLKLFHRKTLATRVPGAGLERYTYADYADRVCRLGAALAQLGLDKGDRVGTPRDGHAVRAGARGRMRRSRLSVVHAGLLPFQQEVHYPQPVPHVGEAVDHFGRCSRSSQTGLLASVVLDSERRWRRTHLQR